MKTKTLAIAMLSAVVLTGCVSKKELEASQQSLQNCTNEKKELYTKMQEVKDQNSDTKQELACLLYTSPSPRDRQKSRMPSSA